MDCFPIPICTCHGAAELTLINVWQKRSLSSAVIPWSVRSFFEFHRLVILSHAPHSKPLLILLCSKSQHSDHLYVVQSAKLPIWDCKTRPPRIQEAVFTQPFTQKYALQSNCKASKALLFLCAQQHKWTTVVAVGSLTAAASSTFMKWGAVCVSKYWDTLIISSPLNVLSVRPSAQCSVFIHLCSRLRHPVQRDLWPPSIVSEVEEEEGRKVDLLMRWCFTRSSVCLHGNFFRFITVPYSVVFE